MSDNLTPIIDAASSYTSVLWPLDRAIAVNPLLDRLDEGFFAATNELGRLLGTSLWPSREHLDAASRHGRGPAERVLEGVTAAPPRVDTLLERASTSSEATRRARRMVGQVLLHAVTAGDDPSKQVLERAVAVLENRAGWVSGSRHERRAVADLLRSCTLAELIERLALRDDTIVAELTAYFARLPGWAAWAKWNDQWRRGPHRSALSRREFLSISLATDLVLMTPGTARSPRRVASGTGVGDDAGPARLSFLEATVHASLLNALRPTDESGSAGQGVRTPRWQVVTCIDVRSEPLRRALEHDDRVETLGFAGFFGIPAAITPRGESEAHESLPVLVAPSVRVFGGDSPSGVREGAVALSGIFADLTHEPRAMFALAEGAGWLGAPLLAARTFLTPRRSSDTRDPGEWTLDAADPVGLAEGALRTMGLTANFAPDVVFLGHGAHTRANTHYATLECGACAGHAGGTNAQILAQLLNEPHVRAELARRGITIPDATRFVGGEHDTTTEVVTLFDDASPELRRVLDAATDALTAQRASRRSSRRSRRALARRAQDWAEPRAEWGLATNAMFLVAPRRSSRGADLRGMSFLHSYDADADADGAVLRSILAAPVVVAQWINAAYYYSSVAPDVMGAGDKTMLNPVGDFAVISGDDPDLRLGLPWQSVSTGEGPWHLPVRLLVAVEAPLERIAEIVRGEPVVRQLVEGEWLRLVGRVDAHATWCPWIPRHGWGTW